MAQPEKKASPFKTIKDVIFLFTSTTRAQKQLNKENKPPLSDDPLEFHSFEIKILITASRFLGFKKAFKGAKNLPNVKDFDVDECKKMFDLEVDEDMVLIKFSQAALTGKKGARKPSRPVKQIGIKGKVQDNAGLTIDAETNIGNGSRGHFQFNPVSNDHGLYLYPVALCITDLVEYIPAGGDMDEDGFGIEELDDAAAEFEAQQAEERDPADEFDGEGTF